MNRTRHQDNTRLREHQDDGLAGLVEAALHPLCAHLTNRQIDLVRAVLLDSLAIDPVTRLLVKRAADARAALARAPRAAAR